METGKDSTAATPAANAGLRGVVAAQSKIGDVNGEQGILIYQGYDIHDLAANSNFEEVVYLLWNERLPNQAELDALCAGRFNGGQRYQVDGESGVGERQIRQFGGRCICQATRSSGALTFLPRRDRRRGRLGCGRSRRACPARSSRRSSRPPLPPPAPSPRASHARSAG